MVVLSGSSRGPGSMCSSISGSALDVRYAQSNCTDWTGIENFISLVNEAGVKCRIGQFQNVTRQLLLKTIITLLVHFKLWDAKNYPNGELQPDLKPDIFITDRNGKNQQHFYNDSLEKFYSDLKELIPEGSNLPYLMFIRPQQYSEYIKSTLCHLGDLCDFIKGYSPSLKSIYLEEMSRSKENLTWQDEILEMEVAIHDVYTDMGKSAKQRKVFLDELEFKRVEAEKLTKILEMLNDTPHELQGLNLESVETVCIQLAQKVEFSTMRRDKLLKSNEVEELQEELSKKTTEMRQLVIENKQIEIKATELECEGFDKAYDVLCQTDKKCSAFVSSNRAEEILEKVLKCENKSKPLRDVVHPELPTIPSSERVAKLHMAKMAKLTKLAQQKVQEKSKLEAKVADAKKRSRSHLHPIVNRLERSHTPHKARGRVDSEE